MTAALNLMGTHFGRLVVIARAPSDKRGTTRWLCECSCGNHVTVLGRSLVVGKTQSCGCYHSQQLRDRLQKYSPEAAQLYPVWFNMLARCENPKNKCYREYGGRGVSVWLLWHSLEQFYLDMGLPPKGMTLERINNNGNYEPGNCCWATRQQQVNNTRHNKLLSFDGQKMNVTQWAKHLGILKNTLQARLRLGWSIEESLTVPVKKKLFAERYGKEITEV